jgi:hypothetical protein
VTEAEIEEHVRRQEFVAEMMFIKKKVQTVIRLSSGLVTTLHPGIVLYPWMIAELTDIGKLDEVLVVGLEYDDFWT